MLSLSGTADLGRWKMLRNARTTASVKLRRSVVTLSQGRQWVEIRALKKNLENATGQIAVLRLLSLHDTSLLSDHPFVIIDFGLQLMVF
tara:strand:+ start:264 stop:530 length:267 start_codon:yes stop_codon:yes gene_type:complete